MAVTEEKGRETVENMDGAGVGRAIVHTLHISAVYVRDLDQITIRACV